MPENIAGIYNYCDRWCERCAFTSRCAVYEDESNLTPEQTHIQNKAFWDRIGRNFMKAHEPFQKSAECFGVEPENLPDDPQEARQRREKIKIEIRQHPLSSLTLEYSGMARDWLRTQPGMLQRLDSLKTELTLGLESREGAKRETGTIKDSLTIIQWYTTFIHIKLVRAMIGKLQHDTCENGDRFQHDFDGSAKIALIAIDRSMEAWAALFGILPEKEDHFLKVLAVLQKIKAMASREFPKAEVFVRPGFDER